MALNIDNLGIVQEELFGIRAKAYNIGLMLKVPVGTLDSIRAQFSDPGDQLRETLRAWLKMDVQHKWQTIVEMLRTNTINEPTVASNTEDKYCQDIEGEPSEHVGGSTPQETKLTWKYDHKAPEKMYRGSVAIESTEDGTIIYCNGLRSTKVYQYGNNFHSHRWSTLPSLPHRWATLVMADNRLTSVGGYQKRFLLFGRATNSLLSLTWKGNGWKWSQHFPPMNTKRCGTAAICHGRFLVVAGGHNGHDDLATVEVLNIDTRVWYFASSLPYPFSWATTSICGEKIYLLGGRTDDREGGSSVLACSISELLHSCQTLSQDTIWQHIADVPCIASSCATIRGQLVIVGGFNDDEKPTTNILIYNESTDSWKTMEPMTTSRSMALVASLHDNLFDEDTLMVIGGIGYGGPLNTVEIADIS